jgi:hypothetical protein
MAPKLKPAVKRRVLLAAQTGDIVQLAALHEAHGTAAAECQDGDDCQPLHRAAAAGQLEAAVFLLDAGVDPDCRKSKYKTPLHEAAAGGHLSMAELLLARGALLSSHKTNGWTPLMYCCLKVTLLNAHSPCPLGRARAGAVARAATGGMSRGTRRWRSCWRGAGPAWRRPTPTAKSRPPAPAPTPALRTPPPQRAACSPGLRAGPQNAFYLACREGLGHMVAPLLALAGPTAQALLGSRTMVCKTPLHGAALNGHAVVVASLLELGADAEARDSCGATPLLEACANGHPAVVAALVAHHCSR